MRKLSVLLISLFAGIATSNLQAQQKSIVETAVAAGNFNTLVAAVKAAGLVETLNGSTEFTVFAPTDEAFAKLDQATLSSLLQPENKDQLTQILTYHVVPGRVSARAAYGLDSAGTVNGQRVSLNLRSEDLRIADSKIIVTDIECSNGVIHVIDTVMLPALENIPSTAKSAGKFNTLLAAVGAAGLADVLSGPGPFTVLAPSDDAFAKLPAGTIDSLLKPANKQKLIDILKYHVISGRVYDTDAVKAASASTLLGRTVNIDVTAEGLSINEANVIAKNVEASNGVIHVIDQVLLPKSMSRQGAMSSLSDAISRGAPAYNAGHHGQCCKIYMKTLKSMQAAGIENADAHMMMLISNTIENAKRSHSSSDRAWVLRRGMDSLYNQLSRMPERTASMR